MSASPAEIETLREENLRLRRDLQALRARILGLLDDVPPERLWALQESMGDRIGARAAFLAGLGRTTTLLPANVDEEMPALWSRMASKDVP